LSTKLSKLKTTAIQELLVILILIFFSLLSGKAVLHKGFFRTVDDLTTVRVDYLYRELKEGNWLNNFPVRISDKLAFDHGYPLYLFYSPFVYYIGALFMFLGKSHIVATKYLYFLPFIFGPLFFYLAARQKMVRIVSLVATIVFTFFPYRGFDLYYRGDAPEFWAINFIPLVFLGVFLLEKNKKFGGLILAFGLFLTIFTHHLTGALLIGFLLIYGLFFLRSNRLFWQGILLAFGLSFFYILPMVFYLQLVKLTYYKKNTLEIIENLIPLKELFKINLKPDLYTKFINFDIGIIILTLLLLYVFLIQSKEKKYVLFWGGANLFFYFLLFEPSAFVWKLFLPYAGILQFPWRLLILINFCLALYFGLFINYLKPNLLKFIFSIFFLIYALNSLSAFKPESYSYFYEYKPEGPCATVSHENEFLPVWVKKCLGPTELLSFDKKNISVNIKQKSSLSIKGKIFAKNKDQIIINKYYFPGWQVFIDGKKQQVDYQFSPYGVFRVFIEKGEHRFDIFYSKTAIMWIADLISFLSLITAVFLFAPWSVKEYREALNKIFIAIPWEFLFRYRY